MKNKLIGFALNCGFYKRIIYLYENETYEIGCFKGTYEKCVNAIKEKYSKEYVKDYIDKLDQCKNMSWLTKERELELVKDKSWEVRLAITRYSDKYHHILVNDENWRVRYEVAKFSDKYHDKLVNDENLYVRIEVAKYSDKYHHILVNDKNWLVRIEIAKFSDKYHHILVNDKYWGVRKEIAKYNKGKRNEKSHQ